MPYKDAAKAREYKKSWIPPDPEKRRITNKDCAKRYRESNVLDPIVENKRKMKWAKDNPEKYAQLNVRGYLKRKLGVTPSEDLVEVLALQRLIKIEIRKARS